MKRSNYVIEYRKSATIFQGATVKGAITVENDDQSNGDNSVQG